MTAEFEYTKEFKNNEILNLLGDSGFNQFTSNFLSQNFTKKTESKPVIYTFPNINTAVDLDSYDKIQFMGKAEVSPINGFAIGEGKLEISECWMPFCGEPFVWNPFFELEIFSPLEIFEYYQLLNEGNYKLNNTKYITKKLIDIVDIFLLIPRGTPVRIEMSYLLSIKVISEQKNNPSMKYLLKNFTDRHYPDGYFENALESSFLHPNEYLNDFFREMDNDWDKFYENNRADLENFKFEYIHPNDIELEWPEISYSITGNYNEEMHNEKSRTFIIRPKEGYSVNYIFNYIKFFKIGETISSIFREDDLGMHYNTLSMLNINIPTTKLSQIKHAFELRVLRSRYKAGFFNDLDNKESFDPSDIIDVFQKRIKYLNLLKEETINEIAIAQEKLPIFIERPFRNYIRAYDEAEVIKFGQNLKDIIFKSIVLLPLEEIKMIKSDESFRLFSKCMNFIKSKNLSDGDWLNLLISIRTVFLNTDLKNDMYFFRRLVEIIDDNDINRLTALVKSRNRYHHAPYDAMGFVNNLKEFLKPMTQKIRKAISWLSFIETEKVVFEDDKTIIHAISLLGADIKLELINFPTEIDAKLFKKNKILVTDNTRAIILDTFFDSKNITMIQETVNVGIFDRMNDSGGFEFEYTFPTNKLK